jgi:hypothetical protein
LGGAAVGVLSSALACAAAAQERTPDARPSAPCVNRDACVMTVVDYESGRRMGREEARAAFGRLRELCDDGEGIACWDLASWTARGIDDIVTADLDAARGFARRSCDLGFDCKVLQALSYQPPTAAEQDDIREAVVRKILPLDRPRNVEGRSPLNCLAFGTDADPAGKDPPPEFMVRFADLENVKPRSWCVENRTGNRYSLGAFDASLRPFPPVRTVRMWAYSQYFNGGGGASWFRVTQESGTWTAEREMTFEPSTLPRLPEIDLAEDRRRIALAVSVFADAWNGRDIEAMARLHAGERDNLRSLVARWDRAIKGPAADTRVETPAEEIEFDKPGSMSATARLRLRGTWTPSPGAIVPLDPWKHEGAVTTVRLQLKKRTSWWEPGDWTLSRVDLPWER